jgi:hypothetical protein
MIRMRSRDSCRIEPTKRSTIALARGARTGVLTILRSGWAVTPPDIHVAAAVLVTTRMSRRRRNTVSTWAKSMARMAWACAERTCREVVRIVEARDRGRRR